MGKQEVVVGQVPSAPGIALPGLAERARNETATPVVSERGSLARVAPERTESDPVIQGRDRRTYRRFVLLWALVNLLFWAVWLRPETVGAPGLYLLFTLALAYDASFLPTMYLFYLGRMRRPRPRPAPPGLEVALITLCVPAKESLGVIVAQLEAMARVRYPHDSWVLDEGNDPAVRAAAKRLGVRYFSRAGIPRCNQATPPFQAKTKADNVNAWLAAAGSAYDFFVQLDVDHRPTPAYLDRVLGYFDDPEVAWVQGPSLYGNLDNWYARGAAEQELVLQGPLQQGFYGACRTPFIIGSHCAYRTRAISAIGGFQPTRAEDHLDTIMLAARGYRGVFVPEVLAVGAGPETFETYLRQQFAWSYSMMQILFGFAPRLVWRCRPLQAIQFLFAQTWYPLWSASVVLLFVTPPIVLLTDLRPSTMGLPTFLLTSLPLALTSFAFWWWSRRWHLPAGLRLSWRGVALHVARWPIVFWALVNVLLRTRHPYMITPKGSGQERARTSLVSQGPYLVLCWLDVLAVFLRLLDGGQPAGQGYVMFAVLGAFWMLAVVATNLAIAARWAVRAGAGLRAICRLQTAPLGTLAVSVFAVVALLVVTYSPTTRAALWHDDTVALASSVTAPVAESAAGASSPFLALVREQTEEMVPIVAALDPALPLDLPDGRVALGAYDPEAALAAVPSTWTTGSCATTSPACSPARSPGRATAVPS